MSTLLPENLNVLENGEYQYLLDGQVVSHKGIDVSSHQGEIDWQAVADSGIRFAIIRAAFRGYGQEGRLVEDSRFTENISGALAAGLDVGVYCFSQAVTVEEAQEELALTLDLIAPYEITYPVVYDWERMPADRDARTHEVTGETLTTMAAAFCRGAEEAARLCEMLGCSCAVLKERSPSCGSGSIYDGTFTRTLTAGDGVTAEALLSAGIPVYGESETEKL